MLCCGAGLMQSAGDGVETGQRALQGESGSQSAIQVGFPLSAVAATSIGVASARPDTAPKLSLGDSALPLRKWRYGRRADSKGHVFSLQIGQAKINLLPPVRGRPASYPAEGAHDAKSVLEWLKNSACGDGFLIDYNRTPVFSDPLRQLDAGEYCYHRVDEQGERHIATAPWQDSRGPLWPGRIHVTALPYTQSAMTCLLPTCDGLTGCCKAWAFHVLRGAVCAGYARESMRCCFVGLMQPARDGEEPCQLAAVGAPESRSECQVAFLPFVVAALPNAVCLSAKLPEA